MDAVMQVQRWIWMVAVIAVLAGCRKGTEPNREATQPSADAASSSVFTGKVLQVLDGGRYSYVEIETEEGTRWVAGPKVTVKPGEQVTTGAGMAMQNFESKILKRTFETVYFVGSIMATGDAGATCPTCPTTGKVEACPMGGAAGAGTPPHGPQHPPTGNAAAMPANAWHGEVLETMDAGRYTYLQIKMADRTIWVAGPQVATKVGDRVEVLPGMEMKGFHSKTLNRDFESVFFTGGVRVTAENTVSAGATPEKMESATAPATDIVPAAEPEATPTKTE